MTETEKVESNGELSSFALLFNEVSRETSKEIVQWILQANFGENSPDVLNLIINSPGGEMASAFAIIDVINSSKIPVRTIGIGEISSAGLLIFIAGAKGQRILTPNTSILSHQWSGGSCGKKHELIATRREHELVEKRMIDHYISSTGLTEAKVKKYLLPDADVYLDAQEAKKYGICDIVALIR